jgi:hypothetical protein
MAGWDHQTDFWKVGAVAAKGGRLADWDHHHLLALERFSCTGSSRGCDLLDLHNRTGATCNESEGRVQNVFWGW